jgi:nitrogen fixation protein NifQ
MQERSMSEMQTKSLPIQIPVHASGSGSVSIPAASVTWATQATGPWQPPANALADDEVQDVIALLMEHATYPGVLAQYLAQGLAVACMGPNHLWQDLGFTDRAQLNALMQEHFTSLKALNVHNMRWKKFFYRTLCERADILICKSPHCEQCEDQPLCFD